MSDKDNKINDNELENVSGGDYFYDAYKYMSSFIRVRRDCIGCGLCEQICPTGAISMANNMPRIDHKLCNHCDQCKRACPTGSLD